MKPIQHPFKTGLLTAALLLATAWLGGCGKKAVTNELLSFVPADTPILMEIEVNDRVLPRRLVKKYEQAFDASLAFQRENLKIRLQQTVPDNASPELQQSLQKTLAFADKWLDPKNIREAGIDPSDMAMALYTDALVPVLRAKIKPQNKMEQLWDEFFALIEDMRAHSMSKGAYVMEKIKVNDQVLYQVQVNDIRFLVYIDKGWLVTSLAPVAVMEKRRDEILGLKKPARSLADSDRVKTFFKQYGYQPGQIFWVDILGLTDYVLDPQNHPSDLWDYYASKDDAVSPVCKTEIRQLVGHFPRLVGGITHVDDQRLGNQLLWEFDPDVASKLAALEGEVPAFLDKPELAYGLSIDLPGSIKALTQLAQAVITQPFQCNHLQPLNEAAQGILQTAQKPLPPFVGNFKGISLSLRNLELNLDQVDFTHFDLDQANQAGHVEAALGVTFENVPALMGLAQLTSPGLAALQLKPDGTPVDLSQLPELQAAPIPDSLKPIWLAMTTDHLFITVGIQQPDVAKKLATAKGYPQLMKMAITDALYLKMMEQVQRVQANGSTGPAPQELQKQLVLWMDYLKKSLWWDRQEVGLDFGERGFEVNATTEY
jgi:hypothetical protein